MYESTKYVALRRVTTLVLLLSPVTVIAQDAQTELARQATDPTASLMALNLLVDYVGDYHGPGENDSLDYTFRPVIPFTAFGKNNILRLTVPYRASGRGTHGLGTISIFDLVIFNESWGRWGVGGVASLAREGSAPDSLALGPAIGAVWQYSPKLSLGAFSQNVFAGDTAVSQLQPIVAYQLMNGWSLSAGDLQWSYDFKASRWVSLPVGFQLGKVSHIGKQPVRYAINPQYNLVDYDGAEGWSVIFTFALLVPGS